MSFLWTWFLCYPVLVAAVVFLQLPLWGGLAGLGAPSLFWHDDLWRQVEAGVAVAFVLSQLAIVGHLLAGLDARSNRLLDDRGNGTDRTALDATPQNAYVVLLTLFLLPYLAPWRLACWGYPLGLGLGTLFAFVAAKIAKRIAGEERVPARFLERTRLLPSRAQLGENAPEHRRQSLYFLAFLGGYVGLNTLYWLVEDLSIGAAFSLCVLVSLVIAVYGYVRFRWVRWRMAIYAGALAVFGVGYFLVFAFLHRVPGLEDRYAAGRRAPLGAGVEAGAGGLLYEREVLAAWRGRFQRPPVLVVVAASGGGIRAAAWTGLVLAELEKRIAAAKGEGGWYEGPGFPFHVRLVTGASGGMVGASYWVASLAAPENVMGDRYHGEVDVVAASSADGLTLLLAHAAVLTRDRGEALETVWRGEAGALLAGSVVDLSARERAGTLPSLVYSPALVEDGRRLLISNLDLAPFVRAGATRALAEEAVTPSVVAVEFFKLFPAAKVSIATAARMSASFPYVTPAVQLPTDPPRRAVDAGYYDNFGVNLAARWIAHHRDWLRANTAGVLLLRLRDTRGRRDELGDGAGLRSRAFSWLTAPLETILRARSTTAGFRNDEQVERLREDFPVPPGATPFFAPVVVEFAGKASLNWYLSAAGRENLAASLRESAENRQALDWISEWWRRRASESAARDR